MQMIHLEQKPQLSYWRNCKLFGRICS